MVHPEIPLRVLSLDGGGVRGLAILIMLNEIMEQVRRDWELINGTSHPKPMKPCEYFDLICGTSTGGLIALMLGRLRYDVPTAIRKYQHLAEDVFTSKYPGKEAEFDHRVLEDRIKRVIARSPLKSGDNVQMKDEQFFPTPGGGCRTLVVAISRNGTGVTPVLMRTYGSPRDNPFPARVWETARATSAAPTFFKPIIIKGVEYGDGGTGWNNPTMEVIIECGKIWRDRPIACLISLGTGLQDPNQLVDRPPTSTRAKILRVVAPTTEYKLIVAKYLIDCLTSCEKVHSSISEQLRQHNIQGRYHRLNPTGLGGIGLEEWKKIGDVKALAESYMMHGDMGDLKEKLAKILLDPSVFESSLSIAAPQMNPPQQSKLGQNTLHLAALNGDVQRVQQILNQEYVGLNDQESEREWTPLMCAISGGHLQVVRLLLNAWAKTDIPGKQLLTPLHMAVMKGHEDIVKLLLLKNPKPNIKDIDGRTPLHYAAIRGELDGITQLLLRNGADIAIENVDGKTPLHTAICEGSVEFVDYFLQLGTSSMIQATLAANGFVEGENTIRMHAEATENPIGIMALLMALDAQRMDIVSLVGSKYIIDPAFSGAIEDAFQQHSPEIPYPSWEEFEQNIIQLGRENLREDDFEDDVQSDDSDMAEFHVRDWGFFG